MVPTETLLDPLHVVFVVQKTLSWRLTMTRLQQKASKIPCNCCSPVLYVMLSLCQKVAPSTPRSLQSMAGD